LRHIYLDHASTTPLDPRVGERMRPYLAECFGNPSSRHRLGLEARDAVERARSDVAKLIGASPEEIVFTGSGSEADNLALKGVAFYHRLRDVHLITTAVEHHAVLNAARSLARLGVALTVLPVDTAGRVDPDAVRGAVRPSTRLVSVAHANNEVGTIQPIEAIGRVARDAGVLFHVDAIQSVGFESIDVDHLGLGLVSLSAHKIYGPKGVGALYVRKGSLLAPIVDGGTQEGGLRAGTLNVAGIVGMGEAARLALDEQPARRAHARRVRDALAERLAEILPEARRCGHPAPTLPGHLHLLTGLGHSQPLLEFLSERRVAASSGSACAAEIAKPSHVLTAMGIGADEALSAIRLTAGIGVQLEDVETVASAIADYAPRVQKPVRRLTRT
jgi:cysteine desulfurase